jgi:general secretion pathway protein I
MMLRTTKDRAGLTLLEVIVAMAIFLISVVAILQMILMGSERAQEVRMQTRTSMRCQGKLSEAMVDPNVLASSAGSYTNFTDDNNYLDDKDLQWKMEVKANEPAMGLYTVTVWVKGDLAGGKTVESMLSQIMLDPSIRGTTFDPAPAPPATTTTGG